MKNSTAASVHKKPKTKKVVGPRTTEQLLERKSLYAFTKGISSVRVDRNLIQKTTRLSARLRKVLAAASPKSKMQLISGIAVDLADFQEIAVEHQRRVKKLSQMRFPENQEQFIDMLYDFEIRLVMHAEWHAKHLKARLAKLKRDLRLTT